MKKKIISLLLAGAMTLGAAAYSVMLGGDTAITAEAAGGVDLWFDHVTVKTGQKNTKSTGMTSYHMYMAKNEIEGFQFFLAPDEKGKFDVSVTDFVNKDGDTLKCELFFEHYFTHLTDGKIPDALPPVTKAVEIAAGTSQGFYGKVKTALDTAPGTYTATLTVAKDGATVKTADITLTVWDFGLAEETPFATAVNLSTYEIARQHKVGDDETRLQELHENYYNFMLENRVSAYNLPVDVLSDEADAYMDNPRVTSFGIGGGAVGLGEITDDQIRAAYEKLSNNPEWADKAYFYFVDEPCEMGKLNQLKAAGERLAALYPGYQMVSPYFVNIDVTRDMDQIEFMADYINIWCTKINAWTPADTTVPGAIHMVNGAQNEKYGDFASRMEKEVAGGDKNWVYYCWEPLGPYTTFDASRQTLEQRVALWQAMDNDVTGFLYFASQLYDHGIWRTIHCTNAGGDIVYGDGLLLYPGTYPGAEPVDGPISSMRFESLRDGIEDFMYLDMAKELISEDAYNSLMDMVTVSAVDWCKDSNRFYEVRVALGSFIESALRNGDDPASAVVFRENCDFVTGGTTFVGGAVPGTTVMSVLAALDNTNGITVIRGGETLGMSDTLLPGDIISLDGYEMGHTIVIKGSVNGDDKINLADVTLMLQKIAAWNVDIDEIAGDVDADGKLTLNDVTTTLKVIAAWNVKFNMTPVVSET